MKRGMIKPCKAGLEQKKGKIKILGISTAFRSENGCAGEEPISLQLLKIALKSAEAKGAETHLIDLRNLKIGICKECYSTCPAQCRFNEKTNQCDCYPRNNPAIVAKKEEFSLEQAYNKLDKKEFLSAIQNNEVYDEGDDMHIIYKAMREADGIIFAGFTNYYSRPALMQLMFSRLCALDGGVEELWGDGKNLNNSIKYAKNPKNKYKQRLFGKQAAFINSSKEGDSVSPDLMKACSMMGMKIIPFSVCYRVNWYSDLTHRSDMKNSLNDKYTANLAKFIGCQMVNEIAKSGRTYSAFSDVV